MRSRTARTLRWLLRAGQLVCGVWLVAAVVELLTAEPALADNCGTFADCFGQTGSAAEATFGLTLLSGLSLALDFVPIVGDVKGVVESVTGEDLLTGEELEPWERALGLIPLLPATDVLRAAGGLDELAEVAASAGRHGDDARDAARGATPPPPPPRDGGGGSGPPRDGDGGGGGGPPRDGGDGPPRSPDDEPPRAPQGSGPVVRANGPDSTLSAPEIDTVNRYEAANPGERLYDYQSRTGQADYDYYDAQGRVHDQIGDPRSSQYWGDGRSFLNSIDHHITKQLALPEAQRGSIILDMTGFTEAQKAQVTAHLDALPADKQALFVRLGF
jgi:hypothetical protein